MPKTQMQTLSGLKLAAVLVLALAAPAFVAAQTASADAKPFAYDVASIKPNKTGSGSTNIHTTDGRFQGTNVSAKMLLEMAYDIKSDMISGVSGPVESARFDIEAKVLDADVAALKKLTPEQRRALLLPILNERFGLKAHIEIKTLPVYDLNLLPGGPKFKPSSVDPASARGSGTNVQNNRELTATAVTLKSLASTLTNLVHRTVIDKTGLAGSFDVALKWTPDDAPADIPSEFPPLFTALEEQLGLKLQSGKGPVPTLVVDHIAMPTAN